MNVRALGMPIGFLAAAALCMPAAGLALGEQEADVRAYFADIPVMANIAACESKFTQFGKGGTTLHGGMGGKMVGIFQIYGDVHADYAAGLGMDIYTTDGNLSYARHLYERQGTTPWDSSASCWQAMSLSPAAARSTVPDAAENPSGTPLASSLEESFTFSRNLSIGSEGEDVRALQRMLNARGYALAASGDGAPGNETTRFGALTRSALQRFQCDTGIVCDGDSASTGYGYFGPRTRAALSGASTRVAQSASPAQGDEITRLQAQIAELTRQLAELIAQRS